MVLQLLSFVFNFIIFMFFYFRLSLFCGGRAGLLVSALDTDRDARGVYYVRCVLGQEILLLPCLSPPRSITGEGNNAMDKHSIRGENRKTPIILMLQKLG